jgi:hypothetical protein
MCHPPAPDQPKGELYRNQTEQGKKNDCRLEAAFDRIPTVKATSAPEARSHRRGAGFLFFAHDV